MTPEGRRGPVGHPHGGGVLCDTHVEEGLYMTSKWSRVSVTQSRVGVLYDT